MNHVADDKPFWDENYKLMTREQLDIPGVHMMGHANFQDAYTRLETHFHKNMEFVVVVKGRQQYTVDEKRYMLYGNEMFMSYPYEPHGNETSAQDVCDFIWFQLDVASMQNFLGLTPPRSEYLFKQVLNYRTRVKKIKSCDAAALKEAFYLLAAEERFKKNLGYGLFLEFILKNICAPDNKKEEEEYSEDIERAISFIHENLFSDINIEVVAEQCGLSPSRFKAKFKAQMGVTPHSYINALKIDSAKIYLKDEKLSVTDISYMLNYSSSHHFASVFKKYVGCTPTEFRKRRFPNIY